MRNDITNQRFGKLLIISFSHIDKTRAACWDIDHVDPCHDFDLSKEEDRLVCFNYKNLSPMWGKDNNHKH